MSSFFDSASLVQIPSGYKVGTVYSVKPIDGDGDLTFTRSNDTATRVGPDGLIQKVRTNVFTYSQNLSNAAWKTVTDGGTITKTANAGTAPDGTNTATRIQIGGGGTYSLIYQDGVNPLGSVVISGYFKRYGGTNQTFRLFGDNGNAYSGNYTATNDWQRFSLSVSATSTGADGFAADASNNASDILVWGMQLETGVLTDYIATTTTAVSVGPIADLPRLDYSGGATCPKLLLEPQRTNLATYSEQFDNADWLKRANIGITANAIVSPDGYTNADKMAATNDSVVDYGCFQIVASQLNTFSVFAKKGEMNYLFIGYNNNYASDGVFFNLNTGAISSNPSSYSATITDFGNGWYRCSVYFATNVSYFFISPSVDGTSFNFSGQSGNGIYIYGAQAELGSYASSYIPTIAAASTKGEDAAYKTGIASLIGQTAGTIYAEFEYFGNTTGTLEISPLYIGGGAYTNGVYIDIYQGNIYAVVFNGGVSQASINIGALSVGNHKVAIAYAANDIVIYLDGTLGGVDTSATIPTMDKVYLGTVGSSTVIQKYTLNQALLFKTRLTNAQLAELTA